MTRRTCFSRLVIVTVVVIGSASCAPADIFQWEYINPLNPAEGKQQSTTLAPDGVGVDAVTGANLGGLFFRPRDLTMAYLDGADLNHATLRGTILQNATLRGANLQETDFSRWYEPPLFCGVFRPCRDYPANLTAADLSQADLSSANCQFASLTKANLSQANLTNANFSYAGLTDADLTGAEVRGANLNGTNITFAQLYATSSYQAHDLTGIDLSGVNIAGGNFAGQNLSNAAFIGAVLRDANLNGAVVRRTNFATIYYSFNGPYVGAGITLAQLYSTSSYQAHDLSEINLYGNKLAGANFVGQNLTDADLRYATLTNADFRDANLTNANFYTATLTDADFTGAEVRGAAFPRYHDGTKFIGGITLAQLYSTASYQAQDLSEIDLSYNDLTGANFAGQNLTNANFYAATLTDADLNGAEVRGATFSAITQAQLYATASYQARDLTGITLCCDLNGANFAGQNLTNADFASTTVAGVDFTGAEVRGARFSGFTLAQLHSTVSYQSHDLSGISLYYSDLARANFAGQNLANASFFGTTLTAANFRETNLTNADFYSAGLSDADFTSADARGAEGVYWLDTLDQMGITTTNLIRPGGHISGLDLDAGETLVVRDYDGSPYAYNKYHDREPTPRPPIPVTIDQHLTMGPAGTLRMVFEADAWDSTISFAPGIPVALGGTLELTFAADVNLASQIGRTFDIFDWTGISPTGAFAIASPYAWDLSNLYTTGEVTLVSIPEPSCVALAAVSASSLFVYRRRKTP